MKKRSGYLMSDSYSKFSSISKREQIQTKY